MVFDKRIRFLENNICQTILLLTMFKYINIPLHESWSDFQTTRYVCCLHLALKCPCVSHLAIHIDLIYYYRFSLNVFYLSQNNQLDRTQVLPVVSMLTVWSLSQQWKTKSCMQVEVKTVQFCVWESWPKEFPRDVTLKLVVLWYLLYMYIRADHSFIWQLLGCVLILYHSDQI